MSIVGRPKIRPVCKTANFFKLCPLQSLEGSYRGAKYLSSVNLQSYVLCKRS